MVPAQVLDHANLGIIAKTGLSRLVLPGNLEEPRRYIILRVVEIARQVQSKFLNRHYLLLFLDMLCDLQIIVLIFVCFDRILLPFGFDFRYAE